MGTNLRRKGRSYPWITKKKSNRKKGSQAPLTASSKDSRYNSSQWKAKRERVLWDFPVCAYCEYIGQSNQSTQVDHITKASEYDGDFFDLDNLVGCCTSCHSKKTSYETHGYRFSTLEGWGKFFYQKKLEKLKGL